MGEARGKPQSFHGIPITNISPSSWNSSVKLLQTVGLFTLPCDKVIRRASTRNSLVSFLALSVYGVPPELSVSGIWHDSTGMGCTIPSPPTDHHGILSGFR